MNSDTIVRLAEFSENIKQLSSTYDCFLEAKKDRMGIAHLILTVTIEDLDYLTVKFPDLTNSDFLVHVKQGYVSDKFGDLLDELTQNNWYIA